MTDHYDLLEKTVIFYPYVTRFLVEGPQVEVTVAASPALPTGDDEARSVFVELHSFPSGGEVTLDTNARELEALGRALVACAKSITLTPEQYATYLRSENDNSKEQE